MTRELTKAKELKAKMKAGKPCIGAQLAFCDPAIAELFGRAGYDWLVLDAEHSVNDEFAVRSMLQAAAHTDAVGLARPLRLDVDLIKRFLDLGSPGVICPFINTGEDARNLVAACRYPPAGVRGYNPRRAGLYGMDADDYFRQANDVMICIPIIETKESVENIEDIVSTDGIDGACMGPLDLSISLGCYKQFDNPKFIESVEKVRRACQKYQKAMGTGCYSLEHARQCVERGDSLVLAGGDDVYLSAEARRCLNVLREVKAVKAKNVS